ncbi:MAG: FAD-dependent oxidoreductase [Bacteroides sp.]|nr:FAD-dependent oxidoreductase [Bacteroides sp.]
MTEELQMTLEPSVAYNTDRLKLAVSTQLNIDANHINDIVVTRRSIDARQRRVSVNLSVIVYIGENAPSTPPGFKYTEYKPVADDAPACIIVGAGPAGLFAALRLIELGIRPIVLERGKDVDSRRLDIAAIARKGVVDPNSNYCFGEGGAGAYSDGKLYTRSKKRGSVDKILSVFHQHGADARILVDAHPHIGSDRLPGIIKNMRHTIENCGGKVIFNAKVSDISINDDGKKVTGVATEDGKSYDADGVILATGHSARDVYDMLHQKQINIEAKGIAVGVRLEHPQQLIDRIRYHSPKGRGQYLPPAEYSLLTRVDDRAVYSFCMCPGGIIVPAASSTGQIVVNGMSPSNRGSRWANSGMVVEVLPEDVEGDDPMRMMKFQEKIEQAFYNEANHTQSAPAQRMTDFVDSKTSTSLPSTSYAPGIHSARVDRLLPRSISKRLQKAFIYFDKQNRGFLSPEATVIGDETRTSSPVRITRDRESLSSTSVEGLFPCGEGAGYAGGIVSAAIDGERCAESAAKLLKTQL